MTEAERVEKQEPVPTGIFKPNRGYEYLNPDGSKSYHFRVMRPITDPDWNRKQAGRHKRMSKKQRLAGRRGKMYDSNRTEA